mmetsp:Transcript_44156/g.91265  ORF Transcript_44156/g.91265 Transcript_44156/m.91265 type:complete len:108 (-) Transcript_44156:550-873(-)
MECLAAACEWLCPSASPPAPARPGARREKFLDRTVEWGPWQGANSPGPEHQVSETETTLPADDSHEVNELHKSHRACGGDVGPVQSLRVAAVSLVVFTYLARKACKV